MYLINIALARVEWSLGEWCIPAGLHWRQSGSLEHLALLFTMTSLHPAFPFYQRDTVRHQLDNVELVIEERMDCHKRMSFQQKQHALRREDLSPRSQSACCIPNQLPNRTSSQREEVHIDKIVLKTISWNRVNSEYSIEVQWSDSTWTTVTKTHRELGDFLYKRKNTSPSIDYRPRIYWI
ncbi:zinc finger CCHC domain-containing protein 2-like [Salvelinus namaycush]|uniref:Zinc finger CCHC domain-containing protein 2-like n=1 Tax=Salvelinus namaycush TaxID=8040 RepID=A0A8U1BZI9_SALNM|nr:zinc finger CCHC domain-containing protein 2-like [Salvelinus namaycush]